MRLAVVAVVSVAVVALVPRLAAAQSADLAPPGLAPLVEPAEPASTVEVHPSYRWQIAASDAVATTMLLAGHDSAETVRLALVTYAIGPAIVHVAHGHFGRAAGSLALRTLLPAASAFVVYNLAHSNNGDDYDDFGAFIAAVVFGGAGGAIAASAIDIGALGAAEYRPARTITPAIAPLAHGGMSLGVAGTF
jgi:hypothetical protein